MRWRSLVRILGGVEGGWGTRVMGLRGSMRFGAYPGRKLTVTALRLAKGSMLEMAAVYQEVLCAPISTDRCERGEGVAHPVVSNVGVQHPVLEPRQAFVKDRIPLCKHRQQRPARVAEFVDDKQLPPRR